ncbi:hypothetical protein [Nitrosospira lacus]|nr:hypothetical protein [Nitrosospira lacus]
MRRQRYAARFLVDLQNGIGYLSFAQSMPQAPPPPPQFSTSAERTSNFL